MKRSFAALQLLLITALMASCWQTGEDWSLCGVDDNLTLKLRVQDDSDLTFRKNIQSVDVLLFDANYYYLAHKRIEKSELDISRDVVFTVSPGVYNVVCWANIDSNSRLSVLGASSNYENSFIEIASAENGSRLYYAPYKTPVTRSGDNGLTRSDDYSIYAVNVPANMETVKELVFANVHRTVQIYMIGYEGFPVYDGKAPVVEQTDAGGRYNALLHADLTPVDLRQSAVYGPVNGQNMYSVEFYSALIPVRNDMYVNVYHPTSNALLASVNLAQYVADKNITDDSVIPIQVYFNSMDTSVSITLPSWLDNPIVPGR